MARDTLDVEKELRTVDQEYVEARIIEALDDLYLALLLWKEGRTRNAAGKAFSAVKALMSALIIVNREGLARLAKNKEEEEWIRKKAHTVPTHSMYELAQRLRDLGVDLTFLAKTALDLHDYQYNGFEPDFSIYRTKDGVLRDLIDVVKGTKEAVDKYFPQYALKEIEGKIEALLGELSGNRAQQGDRH